MPDPTDLVDELIVVAVVSALLLIVALKYRHVPQVANAGWCDAVMQWLVLGCRVSISESNSARYRWSVKLVIRFR